MNFRPILYHIRLLPVLMGACGLLLTMKAVGISEYAYAEATSAAAAPAPAEAPKPKHDIVEDKESSSSSEVDLLTNLSKRRTELDARETELTMRENLIAASGLLETSNLYDVENTQVVHHLDQAMKANIIFKRDIDYIVKDEKVVIIDEFTGRMMDGRRWSNGLHQAVEAKEGVRIEPENQTMASITFQNYFRMYPKLSGMTGTAATEAAEFYDIYKLNVVEIPTNVGVARIDEEDEFYKNTQDKFQAIARAIAEKNKTGQPVLVGTV